MTIPGQTVGERILVKLFVLIPFAALVAAVPIALGWGLGCTNPARLARTAIAGHRDTPKNDARTQEMRP